MKIIALAFCLFSLVCSYAQAKPSTIDHSSKRASFIVMIDSANMTKEGIYLNGYVVHLSHDRIKVLAGKTVRIKGNVTVLKGGDNSGRDDLQQGRTVATNHILHPKVKIIKNQ